MNEQTNEQFVAYERKKSILLQQLQRSQGQLKIKKKTASNLFRYQLSDAQSSQPKIEMANFDNILSLDREKGILDVEGMTSYEKIVEYTLQRGFLPTVAPELKHITIGGAIVGIGIESSGHKFGFVHDGLIEAEVLLPTGRAVLAKPDNEYADLFFALPNSYGTLGYILRAKIQLYPAKPFVRMQIKKHENIDSFLQGMLAAAQSSHVDFIEGLVFASDEYYLMNSQLVTEASQVEDIYRQKIFYQLVKEKTELFFTTYDYIFRYDPDWFWNIPENFFYQCFRRLAPKKWRNSGFYKKYVDGKKRLLKKLYLLDTVHSPQEPLIQDWEVTWDKASDLLKYALTHIDLAGKPWAVIPIKPQRAVTLYPVQPQQFYFNLGCYCYVSSNAAERDPFYYTRKMDDYCFALDGLKMLYSSTFLSEENFSQRYNGVAYEKLKTKYDPQQIFKNLYQKVSFHS